MALGRAFDALGRTSSHAAETVDFARHVLAFLKGSWAS